ncbi:hypothetical protein FHS20_003655 [Phyllobacterium endophyticum]|nr:hypothetical protein [Phyllobacterium endophyticum]
MNGRSLVPNSHNLFGWLVIVRNRYAEQSLEIQELRI